MKKTVLKILTPVVLSMFLFSCGGGESTPKEDVIVNEVEEEVQETCKYAYSNDTKIKWTAFKFTDKVGVGGTLDSFTVKTGEAVEEPYLILKELEFEIYTASVNSNNPDRDKKIVSFFFGKMEKTDVIRGKVMDFSGSPREGSLMVDLSLNGTSYAQQMKYFVEGNSVTINGQIDLINWDAQGAVDALNNVCLDLHTGEDGVSKLWSSVDVEVVSILEDATKSPCKQL